MKLFKATVTALALGTATLAVSQANAEAFVDRYKVMQSLETAGTYTYKAAPTFGSAPAAPVVRESFAEAFADMQMSSANSSVWYSSAAERRQAFTQVAAAPVGNESFADRFARMQSASSNSARWNVDPYQGAPVYATTSVKVAAGSTK